MAAALAFGVAIVVPGAVAGMYGAIALIAAGTALDAGFFERLRHVR